MKAAGEALESALGQKGVNPPHSDVPSKAIINLAEMLLSALPPGFFRQKLAIGERARIVQMNGFIFGKAIMCEG